MGSQSLVLQLPLQGVVPVGKNQLETPETVSFLVAVPAKEDPAKGTQLHLPG